MSFSGACATLKTLHADTTELIIEMVSAFAPLYDASHSTVAASSFILEQQDRSRRGRHSGSSLSTSAPTEAVPPLASGLHDLLLRGTDLQQQLDATTTSTTRSADRHDAAALTGTTHNAATIAAALALLQARLPLDWQRLLTDMDDAAALVQTPVKAVTVSQLVEVALVLRRHWMLQRDLSLFLTGVCDLLFLAEQQQRQTSPSERRSANHVALPLSAVAALAVLQLTSPTDVFESCAAADTRSSGRRVQRQQCNSKNSSSSRSSLVNRSGEGVCRCKDVLAMPAPLCILTTLTPAAASSAFPLKLWQASTQLALEQGEEEEEDKMEEELNSERGRQTSLHQQKMSYAVQSFSELERSPFRKTSAAAATDPYALARQRTKRLFRWEAQLAAYVASSLTALHTDANGMGSIRQYQESKGEEEEEEEELLCELQSELSRVRGACNTAVLLWLSIGAALANARDGAAAGERATSLRAVHKRCAKLTSTLRQLAPDSVTARALLPGALLWLGYTTPRRSSRTRGVADEQMAAATGVPNGTHLHAASQDRLGYWREALQIGRESLGGRVPLLTELEDAIAATEVGEEGEQEGKKMVRRLPMEAAPAASLPSAPQPPPATHHPHQEEPLAALPVVLLPNTIMIASAPRRTSGDNAPARLPAAHARVMQTYPPPSAVAAVPPTSNFFSEPPNLATGPAPPFVLRHRQLQREQQLNVLYSASSSFSFSPNRQQRLLGRLPLPPTTAATARNCSQTDDSARCGEPAVSSSFFAGRMPPPLPNTTIRDEGGEGGWTVAALRHRRSSPQPPTLLPLPSHVHTSAAAGRQISGESSRRLPKMTELVPPSNPVHTQAPPLPSLHERPYPQQPGDVHGCSTPSSTTARHLGRATTAPMRRVIYGDLDRRLLPAEGCPMAWTELAADRGGSLPVPPPGLTPTTTTATILENANLPVHQVSGNKVRGPLVLPYPAASEDETIIERMARLHRESYRFYSELHSRRCTAARVIQRAWRMASARAALFARQQYLYARLHFVQKSAALVVEGLWETVLAQRWRRTMLHTRAEKRKVAARDEGRQVSAANVITRAARRWLTTRQSRADVDVMAVVAARDAQLRLYEPAARCLQRWWRYTKSRLRWQRQRGRSLPFPDGSPRVRNCIARKSPLPVDPRDRAATELQRRVRGMHARASVADLRRRSNAAALQLAQRRDDAADVLVAVLRNYTRRLQRHAREISERQARQQLAAHRVAEGWRIELQRQRREQALDRARKLHHAVAVIQRAYRRHAAQVRRGKLAKQHAREEARRLRQEWQIYESVLSVQCFARAAMIAVPALQRRRAAQEGAQLAVSQRLQRVSRGFQERRVLGGVWEAAKAANAEQVALQRYAITTTLALLRAQVSTRLVAARRLRYLTEKAEMRDLVTEALKEDAAAQVVQRAVRRHQQRQRDAARMREAADALTYLQDRVMGIQRAWRSFGARCELRRRTQLARREVDRRMEQEEVLELLWADARMEIDALSDLGRDCIEESEQHARAKLYRSCSDPMSTPEGREWGEAEGTAGQGNGEDEAGWSSDLDKDGLQDWAALYVD